MWVASCPPRFLVIAPNCQQVSNDPRFPLFPLACPAISRYRLLHEEHRQAVRDASRFRNSEWPQRASAGALHPVWLPAWSVRRRLVTGARLLNRMTRKKRRSLDEEPISAGRHQDELRRTIRELEGQGQSQRDIGKLLGMSHSKVGILSRKDEKVLQLKRTCEFKGGIGRAERYRPPDPCLWEFEVKPKNIARAKYCKVCAPFAKKALSAENANARYKADKRSSPRSPAQIGGPEGKPPVDHAVAVGSLQSCEYRDEHGKRGKGCERNYKLRSSARKYCDPCRKHIQLDRAPNTKQKPRTTVTPISSEGQTPARGRCARQEDRSVEFDGIQFAKNRPGADACSRSR